MRTKIGDNANYFALDFYNYLYNKITLLLLLNQEYPLFYKPLSP